MFREKLNTRISVAMLGGVLTVGCIIIICRHARFLSILAYMAGELCLNRLFFEDICSESIVRSYSVFCFRTESASFSKDTHRGSSVAQDEADLPLGVDNKLNHWVL